MTVPHLMLGAASSVFPTYALLVLLVSLAVSFLMVRPVKPVPRLPNALRVSLLGTAIFSVPLVVTQSLSFSGIDLAVPTLAAILTFVGASRWASLCGPYRIHALQGSLMALAALSSISLVPLLRPLGSIITAHENLLAAHVGVLAFVVAHMSGAFLKVAAFRVANALVIPIALVSALALGSRSALIGIALFAVLSFITTLKPNRSGVINRTWRVTGIAAFVAISLVVILSPGWLSHLTDGVAFLTEAPSPNMIAASEDIGSQPWSLVGVQVARIGKNTRGNAIFNIVKTDDSTAAQAQTKVLLNGMSDYRLSIMLRASTELHPGVRGWASASDTEPELQFKVHLDSSQGPVVTSRPPLSVVLTSWDQQADGWTNLLITLRLDTPSNRPIWLGPTPDVRPGTVGATAEFSEFLLEAPTDGPILYTPTFARSESAETAFSRVTIFRQAWNGISDSPLVGNGAGSFVSKQKTLRQDGFAFPHAHNVILHVLYERGVVGLVGLILMMGGLASVAGWRTPQPIWVLVFSTLAMNLTDYTMNHASIGPLLGGYIGLVAAITNRSTSQKSG